MSVAAARDKHRHWTLTRWWDAVNANRDALVLHESWINIGACFSFFCVIFVYYSNLDKGGLFDH